MNNFRNLKIAINDKQPLDEVLDYVGDDFTNYYTGVIIESIHEILKGTTNEQ